MKFVKTSAIVLAVSAMLSGAALAQQGLSTESQTRGGMQRGAGSGMSAGEDTELNTQAPAGKSGKATTKGTVGSSTHGAASGGTGAAGNGAAGSGTASGKRY